MLLGRRILRSLDVPEEDTSWTMTSSTAPWSTSISDADGYETADFESINSGVEWRISNNAGSATLECTATLVVNASNLRMDGGEDYRFQFGFYENRPTRTSKTLTVSSVPNSDGSGTKTQIFSVGSDSDRTDTVPSDHAAFVIEFVAGTVYDASSSSLLFYQVRLSSLQIDRVV